MADKGKEKCEYLRNVRTIIAKANGIDYIPAECHHEGSCPGFCPACDAEMEYIKRELQKKEERGERVRLAGLLVDDTKMPNYPERSDDISDGEIGPVYEEGGIADYDDTDSPTRRSTGTVTLPPQNGRKRKKSNKKDIPYKLKIVQDEPEDDDWEDISLGGITMYPIDEE